MQFQMLEGIEDSRLEWTEFKSSDYQTFSWKFPMLDYNRARAAIEYTCPCAPTARLSHAG